MSEKLTAAEAARECADTFASDLTAICFRLAVEKFTAIIQRAIDASAAPSPDVEQAISEINVAITNAYKAGQHNFKRDVGDAYLRDILTRLVAHAPSADVEERARLAAADIARQCDEFDVRLYRQSVATSTDERQAAFTAIIASAFTPKKDK